MKQAVWKLFEYNAVHLKQWRSNEGGAGEGVSRIGRQLYRGGNFELQMYFYYTNRGAHIYLSPGRQYRPPPPPHHHWSETTLQWNDSTKHFQFTLAPSPPPPPPPFNFFFIRPSHNHLLSSKHLNLSTDFPTKRTLRISDNVFILSVSPVTVIAVEFTVIINSLVQQTQTFCHRVSRISMATTFNRSCHWSRHSVNARVRTVASN